jgi:glyoxylase-like metal-dependent hydrolase (beta-lactamase superfamily II)
MSTRRDPVSYEFDFQPEPGETVELLPGLKWLRLPLPFMLGHINVWLLRDGAGWAIVDTGIHTEVTRKTWDKVFATHLNNEPVTRVLVTHLHPDHAGCAGWLCETHDVALHMTREEYLLCRILVSDTDLPAPKEGRRFYQAAGFAEEHMTRYMEMFGSFGRVVAQLPQAYHRLHEAHGVQIGAQTWQVITGHGHSPEHACLYDPLQNVLISGDQILPTISPNVSVYPTEPAANPLAGWFDSLHRMKTLLPDDVLVLPSHGRPFRGVMARLDALIEEHEMGLTKLRQLCRRPQRAVDVFPALFKSKITDSNLMMATGEAIAHLNYLLFAGQVDFATDEAGVRWYQTR